MDVFKCLLLIIDRKSNELDPSCRQGVLSRNLPDPSDPMASVFWPYIVSTRMIVFSC